MTPAISFVIPVRNDATRLRRCLESVRAAESPGPVQIIVADNGSTDDSPAVAAELGATVLLLPGLRVSAVRNEATRHATADLFAFVDADHTIDKGWIVAAMGCLAFADVVAAGADYHAPPDGTWVQRTYDLLRRRAPEPRTVDWLGSGNLVVRRTAFEQVGGFDTSLESCEDVDLCRKLRATGGRIVAADVMQCVHHGDPRSLRALFAAELWRGRDNLRVSLRERLTVTSAIGLGLVLVHLSAMILLVAGLVAMPLTGWTLPLGALAVLALLVGLRTLRLLARSRRPTPMLAVRALAVAAVYDSARALALVMRAGHTFRRRFDR
jgi:GT2 family glycosyltransferase